MSKTINMVHLEIPRVPPSYSQIIRMKVRDRIKMKTLWRVEVKSAAMDLKELEITGPHANYKQGFKNIVIVQYRKALIRDKENLWASTKPILDALKHNDFIIDDDMKNINLLDVIQLRATAESLVKTTIIISDPE